MALYKGSRVRIPHKAVAVLAEGSSDVTGVKCSGKAGAALDAEVRIPACV